MLMVISTKEGYVNTHRTNFPVAEKLDQTLRSHGIVQYFRSIHTEL